MKILLLEDDKPLSQILKEILEDNGYLVDVAFSYDKAVDLSYENSYDLYVFDINLPQDDGISLAKSLKKAGDNTPVIFITALVDVDTMASAFNAGAEDFIKKPFYPQELLIRIEHKLKKDDEKLFFKDLELDTKDEILKKDGKIVDISHSQFNILKILMQNISKPVSKDSLIELLDTPSDVGLRVMLNKIKKRFGLDIKNIRGRGYLIEDD
ncbi:MAG TPA: response regulator transcription factor [Arcobacter sp.]|nr:response regulator transcription factor [Arcobacter sp.]